MAFSNNNSGGPMASINVTPLVDVMLVLLIIFMITAPLMTHKIKVDLPNARLQKKPEPPKAAISLTVKQNGDVFWNDEPVSQDLLESRLGIAAQLTPQPELDVRGDRTTRFGTLWGVIQTAQGQGMQKVGFISQPRKSDN